MMETDSSRLAIAVERNQIEWVAAMAGIPDVEVHRDDDVIWTCSRLKGRGNHVCAMRFESAIVEARLDRIFAVYRARRVGAQLWVGPSALPPDLESRLRRRGLRRPSRVPALAVELRAREPVVGLLRSSGGISVRAVDDLACFAGREHPIVGPTMTAARRALVESYVTLARAEPRRLRQLVAWLGDEPVGVATLFVAGGVAGVYDLGVVERCRRRGVGSALVAALFRTAIELGEGTVALLASGMGESLYARFGFQRVGEIARWHYSRAQQAREEALGDGFGDDDRENDGGDGTHGGEA